MNNQEIFDRVVERLRDGTGRAVSDKGLCLYKAENGLKCAVGIFIKEGHEAYLVDGGVDELLSLYDDKQIFGFEVDENTLNLLSDLQLTHDNESCWYDAKFDAHGEYTLNRIAQRFNLTYTSP